MRWKQPDSQSATEPHVPCHHFVGGCIPLVAAAFALGGLTLLGVDAHRDRAAARAADRLAAQLPWQRTLGELNRAVAGVALASALTHRPPSPDDQLLLDAATSRLRATLDAGEPYARAVSGAPAWQRARAELGGFQRRALEERGDPERRRALFVDTDAAFAALRGHSAAAGDDARSALDELSRLQRAGLWLNLEVMALVAAAALLALAVIARRERRARRHEAAFVAGLAERNADLDAFAGRLAHDLRNPLSPILLGVQRIERADVPPEVRELASGVERSARRLLDMIEVVLDFTRAQAPPVDEIAPSDVAQVIEETLGFFHERARLLGARFEVAVERGLCVRCESAILSSVMQNLIENALKYGCQGSSRAVYVRACRRAAHALIEVEDQGQGIPPEVAERVFEPRFQQRRGSSGLGLGLATVKRLLAGRAGSIELGRGAGGGALFRVRLTSAPASAPALMEHH